MITSTQLYWITRLNSIAVLLHIVGFISVAAIIATVAGVSIDDADWKGKITKKVRNAAIKKVHNAAIPCFLLSVVGLVFIPTTKEMAAMLVIPQIANSEKVQAVGGKLYDLAVEWMDELKPNHEVHQ